MKPSSSAASPTASSTTPLAPCSSPVRGGKGAEDRRTQEVTGEAPAIVGVPYGADMRLFIHLGGMPCVMYGAGDVSVAHAPDEHISITELLGATSTVACLLAGWCGTED